MSSQAADLARCLARDAEAVCRPYLRKRGITALHDAPALRFHPRCYYRPDADAPTEIWPALIAAVTDLGGNITGAHRTWLDPMGAGKAPIDTPRRAMGHLLGHGVRLGVATDVMAAGEGIETMLSVRSVLRDLPMVAALSANHLATILFGVTLRRLYVVCDDDPAGDLAAATLTDRAQAMTNGTMQGTSPRPSTRTSSPVATNSTPGMRRAAAASMRLICACATGERSTKACVIRGRITSSV